MDLNNTQDDSDDSALLFKQPVIKKKVSEKLIEKKVKTNVSRDKLKYETKSTQSKSLSTRTKRKCDESLPTNIEKVSKIRKIKTDGKPVTKDTDLMKKIDSELTNPIVDEVQGTAEIGLSEELQVNSSSPKPNALKTMQLKSTDIKSSFMCPLCWKKFDNKNGHVSHMKQCAKKRKMTTQQLLDAIQLQEKQQEERQALGLSQGSKNTAITKASPRKKKTEPEFQDLNYEMALALAMSRSLDDAGGARSSACTSDPHTSSVSSVSSVSGVSSAVLEAQKATLEKFGFTSSSSSTAPTIGRKKVRKLVNSVLKTRSKEERERLMTEKAAVVLLDEDKVESGVTNQCPNAHKTLWSSELLKLYSEPQLWECGQSSHNSSWYVPDLQNVMMSNLSEVSKEVAKENNDSCISPLSENITTEIASLNLPQGNLHMDWRKLINNQHLSDLSFLTRNEETMYLHSVVVYARLPSLLCANCEVLFNEFDSSIVLHFLEFLYCGVLTNLKRSEVIPLQELSKTVEYQNLNDVLCLLNDLLAAERHSPSTDEVIPSSVSPRNETQWRIETADTEPVCQQNAEMWFPPDATPNPPVGDAPFVCSSELQSERKTSIDVFSLEDTTNRPNGDIENMVDLTQSSHECSENQYSTESDNEPNVEKSYWSFIQNEKKRKEVEDMQQEEEEEKENRLNSEEMYKLETIMKQQKEMSKIVTDKLEREDEEMNIKNRMELDKIYHLSRNSISEQDEDIFDEAKPDPVVEDCILISSDSNMSERDKFEASTDEENTEKLFNKSKPPAEQTFEIPYFDPYENDFADFHLSPLESRNVTLTQSQSLVSGNFSPLSSRSRSSRRTLSPKNDADSPKRHLLTETPKKTSLTNTLDRSTFIETPKKTSFTDTPEMATLMHKKSTPTRTKLSDAIDSGKPTTSPACGVPTAMQSFASPSLEGHCPLLCSTPLTSRSESSVVNAQNDGARPKNIKGLRRSSFKTHKKRNPRQPPKRPSGRLSLRSSLLNEVTPRRKSQRPCNTERRRSTDQVAELLTDSIVEQLRDSPTLGAGLPGRRYLEMTPGPSPGVEYLDRVSPLPDYSAMEATLLKKHLAKYGLKKGLAKNKAKKILRHIYDELHPVINTRTGKIVKFLPEENVKGKGKGKVKGNTKPPAKRKTAAEGVAGSSKDIPNKALPCEDLDSSLHSLDRSTDEEEEGSEFEYIEEDILTQPETNLAIALQNLFQRQPDIHRKVLMYEPIWLEQLQKDLQTDGGCKFKLSNLMDYLDEKCITFRSEALKRNNQKRNEKKLSPRKRVPKTKKSSTVTGEA